MKFLRATAFFLLFSLLFSVSFQQAQDDTVCSSNSDCEANEFCNKEFCFSKEGICSPRGEFCTDEIDPICGCDGNTYPNSCKAMSAGVDLAKKGECTGSVMVVTCSANEECGKSEFCFFEDCEDTTGTCVSRGGDFCSADFDPVCGCDRRTYSNRCSAFNSGASINNKGACDNEGVDDGSKDDSKDGSIADDDDEDQKDKVCESTQDCASFEFCNKETCETRTGICVNRTVDICPAVFDPVCGCNGQTYSSECDALSEGVLLKSKGACVKLTGKPIEEEEEEDGNGPDLPCGANFDCADGFFCNKEKCSDKTGICSPKAAFCAQILDPVCGCDGKTYTSACAAKQQGALVAAAGACRAGNSFPVMPPAGVFCGSSSDCASGQYCATTKCNTKAGLCTKKPEICAATFSPVCDCNGKTHPSECHAASTGANIMHAGKCKAEEKQASCSSHADCEEDDYCKKESCGVAKGMCVDRGFAALCAMDYKPVCGCDGRTHSNPCRAGQAGANIAYEGECGKASPTPADDDSSDDDDDETPTPTAAVQPPAPVPTDDDDDDDDDDEESPSPSQAASLICADDAECPADDDFCYKDACNAPQGVCTKNTDIVCLQSVDPICGCDGKTYGSACKALAAGVNVDRKGSCDNGDNECDGNEDCKKAEYCAKESCSAAKGKCSLKTEFCTQVISPVCGCDGKTHNSACHASSVGVNVKSSGPCSNSISSAKCFVDEHCQKGFRCAKSTCDGAGVCQPKSARFCLAIYKPVCGCDGKTYSNSCQANIAGATINFSGECKKNRKLKRRK